MDRHVSKLVNEPTNTDIHVRINNIVERKMDDQIAPIDSHIIISRCTGIHQQSYLRTNITFFRNTYLRLLLFSMFR